MTRAYAECLDYAGEVIRKLNELRHLGCTGTGPGLGPVRDGSPASLSSMYSSCVKEIVSVTARGHGVWEEAIPVEIATKCIVKISEDGVRSQSSTSYLVLFPDTMLGARGFHTEADRSAFLAESFKELSLEAVEPPEQRERPHALSELVGSDLAAVIFVRDYLQLQFDGGTVNLYLWPRIRRENMVLNHLSAGYSDTLISLINTPLSRVDDVLDLGLVFDFAGGSRLTVPLDDPDFSGPEIAVFHGANEIAVWPST